MQERYEGLKEIEIRQTQQNANNNDQSKMKSTSFQNIDELNQIDSQNAQEKTILKYNKKCQNIQIQNEVSFNCEMGMINNYSQKLKCQRNTDKDFIKVEENETKECNNKSKDYSVLIKDNFENITKNIQNDELQSNIVQKKNDLKQNKNEENTFEEFSENDQQILNENSKFWKTIYKKQQVCQTKSCQQNENIIINQCYLNQDLSNFQPEQFKQEQIDTVNEQANEKNNYKIEEMNGEEELMAELNEQLIHNKKYLICKYIAKGGFSIVYSGKILSENNQKERECIFKIIRLDESDQDKIEEEIKIMKRFEKNIFFLQYIDKILLKNYYVLVLEKCKYSLQQKLKYFLSTQNEKDKKKQNKNEFTFLYLLHIVFDLLNGLILLRAFQILHFDIKLGNILINQQNIHVISDFGESFLKTEENQPIEIKGFTKFYAPNELKNKDETKVGNWTDTYCLGKTFKKVLKIYEMVRNCKIKEFDDLVELMIKENPNERPDCLQIHEKFVNCVLKLNVIEKYEFFKFYMNKVEQLLILYPYDDNKDIQFYQDVQVYYNKQQLSIYEQINNINLPFNKPSLALYYYKVGDCYYQQRRQEGLEYLLKSLQLMNEIYYNSNHINIANILFRIDWFYYAKSQFSKAYQYQEQALLMRKELFRGENPNLSAIHPDIASSLNDLGMRYQNLGNNKEALCCIKEAIEMSEKIYQDIHPNTSYYLNCLAIVYQNNGQYEEALSNLIRANEILKIRDKNNLFKISLITCNIGNLYNFTGDYKSAQQNLLVALKIRQRIFNEFHSIIATNKNYLGDSYFNLQDYDTALKYQLDSLKIRQQLYKGNHSTIATSLTSVGICLQKLGNHQSAINYLIQSLNMRKSKQLGNQFHISISLNKIGEFYLDLQDYKIALKYFQESFFMAKNILQKNHPHITTCLQSISLCCQKLGKLNKSIIYFIKLHEINFQLNQQKSSDKNKTNLPYLQFYFDLQKYIQNCLSKGKLNSQ